MPDHVNEWFSAAAGCQVVLLHCKLDQLNPNPLKRAILKREGDSAKGFTHDAAIHMVNEASVRDIQARVEQKYPESERDQNQIKCDNFRPNILVDS